MSQKCLYQVFPKLSLMVSLVEITPGSFILSAVSGIYRVPVLHMVNIASRMSQFRGTTPGLSVRRWTLSLSSKCLQSSGDRQAPWQGKICSEESPQGTKNTFPSKGPSVPVPSSHTGSPRPSPQPCEAKSQGNRKGLPMKSPSDLASPWVPNPPEPNLPAARF